MKILFSMTSLMMLMLLQGCANTGPNPLYLNADGSYSGATSSATTNQSYIYRSPSPAAVGAVKAGGGAGAGGGGGHGR